MPVLSKKAAAAIKILAISIVGVLVLYLIYGVIGCFWLLGQQPSFVTSDGITTISKGFWLQGLIYVGLLAFTLIIESLLTYFLFFHNKVVEKIKNRKESKLETIKQEE